ncbi:MAG: SEC-C domain-containing protein [Sphingomonadales bacterium]|nr:SEC-C domain-containing protein [Sphingomonadales bacterium]
MRGTHIKVGRNEPCPCGGGKRFKHCHGKVDEKGRPCSDELMTFLGHLRNGFVPIPCLFDGNKDEIPNFPSELGSQNGWFAVPMRSGSKEIVFCFKEADTLGAVRESEERAMRPKSWDVRVEVRVTSIELPHNEGIDLKQLIESLAPDPVVDVRKSDVAKNHFEIWRTGFASKDEASDWVNYVDSILVELSADYHLGFFVHTFSTIPVSEAQPQSWHPGKPASIIQPPNFALLATTPSQKPGFADEAPYKLALREIYAQTNIVSRLTVSWNVLETLFGQDKPVPLFERSERVKLKKALRDVEGIDAGKLAKLRELLNRLATKNRNQRIAEKIGLSLAEDPDAHLAKIKRLSELRGKCSHRYLEGLSVSLNVSKDLKQEVLEASEYVIQVLMKMITDRKCGED